MYCLFIFRMEPHPSSYELSSCDLETCKIVLTNTRKAVISYYAWHFLWSIFLRVYSSKRCSHRYEWVELQFLKPVRMRKILTISLVAHSLRFPLCVFHLQVIFHFYTCSHTHSAVYRWFIRCGGKGAREIMQPMLLVPLLCQYSNIECIAHTLLENATCNYMRSHRFNFFSSDITMFWLKIVLDPLPDRKTSPGNEIFPHAESYLTWPSVSLPDYFESPRRLNVHSLGMAQLGSTRNCCAISL